MICPLSSALAEEMAGRSGSSSSSGGSRQPSEAWRFRRPLGRRRRCRLWFGNRRGRRRRGRRRGSQRRGRRLWPTPAGWSTAPAVEAGAATLRRAARVRRLRGGLRDCDAQRLDAVARGFTEHAGEPANAGPERPPQRGGDARRVSGEGARAAFQFPAAASAPPPPRAGARPESRRPQAARQSAARPAGWPAPRRHRRPASARTTACRPAAPTG